MKFSGIQKLTLLDFPGVVACTIFTAGCNFNCPFCHNASLVDGTNTDSIDENEVLDFLKKRIGILEGVVITGGEPLLHQDIHSFLYKVKELGYLVKLDTNGSNPTLLEKLIDDKLLDYVAMDIKNSPGEYFNTIGTDRVDFSKIELSKNLLLQGRVDYEFRTTVVKPLHTLESLTQAAKWIENADKYFLQQFKDSGELINPEGLSAYTPQEMQEFTKAVSRFCKSVNLRGI